MEKIIKQRWRSVLAFSVLPVMAWPALAQDAGEDAASATGQVQLAPLLVEGTFTGDVSGTPGAAHELTAEQIAERRPYSLHDALGFVPGVRTMDDDALGRRSGIGVRGAPTRRSRNTLLLEDGVPINAAPYLDASGHYTPPVQRLESVEVLKGTGHIIHGPLNNHGIVNFRSISPTLAPLTTVEFAAGNRDSLLRHIRHQRTDGRLGSVFSFTGMDAKGVFDVEEHRFDDYYAGFTFALNERHTLAFSATHFRERSQYDESNLTPIEYATAPRRKTGRFGNEFNNIGLDYTKFDLSHQWRSGAVTLSSRVYGTDLDRPRFTVDPGNILVDALPEFVYENPDRAFVPGVSGVMVSRAREYRQVGGESRVVLALPGHEWSFGVQASRSLFEDRRSFGDVGEILNTGNRGRFTGQSALAQSRLEKYQSSAGAVYVQDAISVGNWVITPGVRAEHYTVVKAEKFRGDTVRTGFDEDDNTLVLPSLSALWLGPDNTQVFANVARGYTPAFARTAEGFPLKPETGINSQVGLRRTLANGLSFDGAVFYNVIRDTIVQLPFTLDDDNIRINAEDSVSYGIDIGVRYETPTLGNSAVRIFSDLAYSHAVAEFSDGEIDGNDMPNVPNNVGSLTIGFRDPARWHASITLSHFGAVFSDLNNTDGLVLADDDREPVQPGDAIGIREIVVLGRVPSRNLLSARAGWTLPTGGPDTEVWISGRNLTDKLYINDLENGIRPGIQRTVLAGVTVRF